jgi:hypothetical protein
MTYGVTNLLFGILLDPFKCIAFKAGQDEVGHVLGVTSHDIDHMGKFLEVHD